MSLSVLAGCSAPNDSSIGARIKDELEPHVAEEVATVDLGAVIDGSWTEVVIACRGVNEESVNSALGFKRQDGPSVNGPGFGAVMLFSTGDRIERYFTDDNEDEWYFSPCPPLGLDDSLPVKEALVLPRGESALEFFLEDSQAPSVHWHVPRDFFDEALKNQSSE